MSEVIKGDQLDELDIDTLLDLDIESVESVPELRTLPKGAYNFEITSSDIEENNGQQAIVVKLKVLEVVELLDEEENPESLVGQLLFQRYKLGGKSFAFRLFSTTFEHCAKALNAATPRDLIEGLNGMQVTGVVKHRKFKTDDGEERINANLDAHALFPTE